MIPIRVASAALIGVSFLSLAACGGEESPTAAATQPAPTAASATATQPAPTATSAAAEPAAGARSDKEICTDAKKAGEASKKMVLDAAVKSGGADLTAADYKTFLTMMADQLTAAAGASDSKVGAAAKAVAAGATKAASSTDPATAMADPGFEKVGAELTAACKPTGVNPNF